MTHAERQAEAQRIAAKLEGFGIPVNPYLRGPNGSEVFSVAISGSELRLWPGDAEIQVRGSSAKRQAVLRVVEKTRSITHKVESSVRRSKAEGLPDISGNSYQRQEFISNFPVALPGRVRWTVSELEDITDPERDKGLANEQAIYRRYRAKVRATISRSEQSLLVGMDEEHVFVSLLAEPCDTISEAYEILRPDNVPVGSPRQGEWFFVPVTDAGLKEQLDRRLVSNPTILDDATSLTRPGRGWGRETTHFAHQLLLNGKTYAIGWVTDRNDSGWRWGRTTTRHHSPLLLHDWHEAIHNRERQAPDDMGNTRSWD